MKPADVKNLGKDFWNPEKNPDIMAAIQRFWGGPQLGRAAEEFGRRFVVDYMEVVGRAIDRIKRLPPDQAEREYKAYIYVNPARARYLESTAAQVLGFTSLYAMAPDVVKRKYRHMRDILKEMP
jgi:hypothetical protein